MIRAVAALVVLLAAAPSGAADAYRAPNFRTTDVQGRAVTLEDYLGKGPVVVDFWATWCKPCIKELPFLQRLHDEYAKHGLQVLAVSIDSPKSQSRVRPFIKGHGFTFHVLMDGDQEVFRQLQGEGSVPYVLVLDRDGFVRYRHTGYRPGDEEELEKVVREMLGPALDAPAEGAEEAAPDAPDEASSG